MSSKSDRDNRSNQLNPNNDAYHSSRGSNRPDDDNDNGSAGSQRLTGSERWDRAVARLSHEIHERARNQPVETTFRAAFVALTGAVKIIEFSVATSPFLGGEAANEDLAEILIDEIGRQLSIQWDSCFASQMLYDQEGTEFFWAGFEYPKGQWNGSDKAENERLWNAYGKEATLNARASLITPTNSAYPIEQWGRVEKHPSLALTRLSPDFHQQITDLIALNERRVEAM